MQTQSSRFIISLYIYRCQTINFHYFVNPFQKSWAFMIYIVCQYLLFLSHFKKNIGHIISIDISKTTSKCNILVKLVMYKYMCNEKKLIKVTIYVKINFILIHYCSYFLHRWRVHSQTPVHQEKDCDFKDFMTFVNWWKLISHNIPYHCFSFLVLGSYFLKWDKD